MTDLKTPAPLYRDPVYDGAADPVLIYNREKGLWWMIYTQRRAILPLIGVTSSHGTALGAASSRDGREWTYRGPLNLEIERGHNTYWAPEIFFDESSGLYHMYVTYIRGIPSRWGGSDFNGIAHCTSPNLWDWEFQGFLTVPGSEIIDACIQEKPYGGYRMWFRDTGKNCAVCAMDSEDLYTWSEPFSVIDDEPSEGPNVFPFKGYYWLITDPLGDRHGLAVYRSDDMDRWDKQGYILQKSGTRFLDDTPGRHADVTVIGGRAYIIYFTQPWRDYRAKTDFTALSAPEQCLCVIQAARLEVINGELTCDRDEDFEIELSSLADSQRNMVNRTMGV